MEPQQTAVPRPIQLQIADDIRLRIERHELAPGESLPTLQELTEQWSCSMNSARAAVALLKQQGLISGGRGRAPVVRMPARRVVRSSDRHQLEKDLALRPEVARGALGASEIDMGVPLDTLDLRAEYAVVPASEELATLFEVEPETDLLQRRYETVDSRSGRRESWSVSHIPHAVVRSNPDLLDASNEPWPGGTLHQLHTVGVEIMRVVDEITSAMPTTASAQLWGLDDGIPILRVRRLSYDVHQRLAEVSDAEYPADRTLLQFATPLRKW